MTRFRPIRLLPLLLVIGMAFGPASTASANTAGAPSPAALSANPLLQKVFLGFGENKKEPAPPPEYRVHDDASFQKETKIFGMMPFGRADLEYEIRLPADWKTTDLLQNSTVESAEALLGDIARYESPVINTHQARIRIQAVKLETEIDAPSWLENYMLANGYSVQGKIDAISLRSASAAYISIENNITTYNYMAARFSGPYVLVARFEEPIILKNYMAYIQKKTIDSFRILYPKEEPVENQRSFTLVDSMKFGYPESWVITSNQIHDMSNMSVDLQSRDMNGKVEGYIRFVAVRRSSSTNLEKAIADQKKFFTNVMGLKFTKLKSTEETPAYNRFIFNREEDYEVVSTKSANIHPQEVQFVMLGDKEFYIFGFLFTQNKSSNLPSWARNTQTFRVILQSIR
jgi:hypothetical protein